MRLIVRTFLFAAAGTPREDSERRVRETCDVNERNERETITLVRTTFSLFVLLLHLLHTHTHRKLREIDA